MTRSRAPSPVPRKTLHNLDWFEVTDTRGRIEEDGRCRFQVTLKVGFRLDEPPA